MLLDPRRLDGARRTPREESVRSRGSGPRAAASCRRAGAAAAAWFLAHGADIGCCATIAAAASWRGSGRGPVLLDGRGAGARVRRVPPAGAPARARPAGAEAGRRALSACRAAYRCDLITGASRTRAAQRELAAPPLSDGAWRSIGAAIARLHHGGVDHADLNAHNILLDRARRGQHHRLRSRPLRAAALGRRAICAGCTARCRNIAPVFRPVASARAWRALLAGYRQRSRAC